MAIWLRSLDKQQRAQLALGALAVALLLTWTWSIGVGAMRISWFDSVQVLLNRLGFSAVIENESTALVVETIRLPRTLMGLLVGAVLAVSGAAIQGVFRNPLADPGLIGVTGGAALAAVSVIVLGETILLGYVQLLGPFSLILAGFVGGLTATLIVARIATNRYGTSITTMLLAGIAMNVVTVAGLGVFSYIANDSQLRTLTFWTMGGLGGATWTTLMAMAPIALLVLFWLPRLARSLNALLLGESEALHLGINVHRVKRQVTLLSALGVGAAVAVSGSIGFVGLVVPHLVRLTLGPDHRYLLPASAMLGGLFLLGADMIARTILAPAELPIGLITSLIGGPFFIGLIILRQRSQSL